jgi:hypothetical protein
MIVAGSSGKAIGNAVSLCRYRRSIVAPEKHFLQSISPPLAQALRRVADAIADRHLFSPARFN